MLQVCKNVPKISCLMVTANGRFDFFKQSCQCYFDQTYPNKELVVVNEGSKAYQAQIAEFLAGRNDIRLVFLDGWYSLGSLRNISIALSSGDIFVQWDDDDFNMPERLSLQSLHLKNNPRARTCFLSDQLHFYFNNRYLFWEDWAEFHSGGHKKFSVIPGTIMAWREGFWARYPSGGPWCSAGEDSVLTYRLCDNDEQVLLMGNHGYMQMYTYHGKNVWDVEHHLKISKERAKTTRFLFDNELRIRQAIDYLGLHKSGPIKVMGRDGFAFTHEGINDQAE